MGCQKLEFCLLGHSLLFSVLFQPFKDAGVGASLQEAFHGSFAHGDIVTEAYDGYCLAIHADVGVCVVFDEAPGLA